MTEPETVVEDDLDEEQPQEQIHAAAVEVRRNAPLGAVIGLAGTGLAIAYLARATGTGGTWVDVLLCVVTGLVGVVHLAAFLDSRAPLLIADTHGVRLRRGRSWRGVAWPEVDRVEHRPRAGLLRDGGIVVVAAHDEELSVPLSLSTRLVGATDATLTAALDDLTAGLAEVVEVLPPVVEDDEKLVPLDEHDDGEDRAETDPEPDAEETGDVEVVRPTERAPEPVRPSATPSPLRQPVVATRAEIAHETIGATALRRDASDPARLHLPEVDELRRESEVDLVTLVIQDVSHQPTVDPVVGSQLAAARARLGLSVDQLAERTRIRPHVIESIEVDDFAPCGGDFYARGHLRTLARVLGVDGAPLLASYDEKYADAPIDPRRVFEAELATGRGGSIRGTRGGPNWSVLVAAVMAVVLVWSIARLIMDGPVPIDDAPILNPSGGINQNNQVAADAVPVVVTAAGGGAKVVVRDGAGKIVFDGNLAFGQTSELEAVPPVRVWSSDGSVTTAIDGAEASSLGETGREAQKTLVVR